MIFFLVPLWYLWTVTDGFSVTIFRIKYRRNICFKLRLARGSERSGSFSRQPRNLQKGDTVKAIAETGNTSAIKLTLGGKFPLVKQILIDTDKLYGVSLNQIAQPGQVVLCEVIDFRSSSGTLAVKILGAAINRARHAAYLQLGAVEPYTFIQGTVMAVNADGYHIHLLPGVVALCSHKNMRLKDWDRPLQPKDSVQVRLLVVDEETETVEVTTLPSYSGDKRRYINSIANELKELCEGKVWIEGIVVDVQPFVGVYVQLQTNEAGPEVIGLIPTATTIVDLTTVKPGSRVRVLIDSIEVDLKLKRLKVILDLVPPESYNGTMNAVIKKLVTQNITPALDLEKGLLHNCVIVGVDKNVAFLRISNTGVIGILPTIEVPDNVVLGSFCPARVNRVITETNESCSILAQSFIETDSKTRTSQKLQFVLLTTTQDPTDYLNASPDRKAEITESWYCGWTPTLQYHREEYNSMLENYIYTRLGPQQYAALMNERNISWNRMHLGVEFELMDKYGNDLPILAEWAMDPEKYYLLTPKFLKQYWYLINGHRKTMNYVNLQQMRQMLLEIRADLAFVDTKPNTQLDKLKKMIKGEPLYSPAQIFAASHLSHNEKLALMDYVERHAVDPIQKIDIMISKRNNKLGPDVVMYHEATRFYNDLDEPTPPPDQHQLLLSHYRGMMKRMKGNSMEEPTELPFELEPGFELVRKYEDILRRALSKNRNQHAEYMQHVIRAEDLIGDTPFLKTMRTEGSLVHGATIPLPKFPDLNN